MLEPWQLQRQNKRLCLQLLQRLPWSPVSCRDGVRLIYVTAVVELLSTIFCLCGKCLTDEKLKAVAGQRHSFVSWSVSKQMEAKG